MREITAQSTEITLIGQFIESEFLFELMEANQEVKFTILVDDAYHYVFSDGQDLPFNFISEESAQRLATFAQEQANVQLRFLQTNHHFESHGLTNTVHARSALFVDDTGPIECLLVQHTGGWGMALKHRGSSLFEQGSSNCQCFSV
jgi:hypothetical protein